MTTVSTKKWFRPKAFGYGATPSSWQGWLATFLFVVAVTVAAACLHGAAKFGVVAALTGAFGVLAFCKTDGAWRWRLGKR